MACHGIAASDIEYIAAHGFLALVAAEEARNSETSSTSLDIGGTKFALGAKTRGSLPKGTTRKSFKASEPLPGRLLRGERGGMAGAGNTRWLC